MRTITIAPRQITIDGARIASPHADLVSLVEDAREMTDAHDARIRLTMPRVPSQRLADALMPFGEVEFIP